VRQNYIVTSKGKSGNGYVASGYLLESYRNYSNVSYGTAGSKTFAWSPPVTITCNG
jgi:hypothetical protein